MCELDPAWAQGAHGFSIFRLCDSNGELAHMLNAAIESEATMMMKWVYWLRLYDSKFQAGCLVRRMEHDGWIYGVDLPKEIEVFRSRKGRYGVRYIP